jgi:His/Glu/Gln/Arg/opine family amino acid ABC transporter permease subunit
MGPPGADQYPAGSSRAGWPSLGGIVFGAMRSSGWRLLKVVALVYIEAVRSIPFVILLFFVFFALPLVLDIWTSRPTRRQLRR